MAQDASVKVRRAAFALWLQAHALPSSVTDGDVAGLNRGPPVDLDTAALRLLAQRVEDRCDTRCLAVVLPCFDSLYPAAHHGSLDQASSAMMCNACRDKVHNTVRGAGTPSFKAML